MTIRNLHKFFNPKRIAVVGASDHQDKVGYTVLRNLVGHGYQGVVYPVNSKRESAQGIVAYKSLADLPQTPDLVVICTPAETVPELVDECGRLGIMAVMILSAGFREIGPEGKALEDRAKVAASHYRGLRILGPNCLGIIVPAIGLNASFAATMALPGRVAFLSQSGALCTSVLDWANSARIGFSLFVSLGNMLDVGIADLLDYLANDPSTDAVVFYVESITEARQFMSAARALSRNKPIVAYKAGRFADSAQAAASHTGAMAGVDEVYEAAFRRAGIVRVFDFDEMFDCAALLARQRITQGSRLTIITNAGGPGVMACDALIARRGILAALDADTINKLNVVLPRCWSHGNPIDILGDAPPERYATALRIVLADANVDAVLILLTPQAMTNPLASAMEVIEAAHHSTKPLLACWMGAENVQAGVDCLREAGIPTYSTPEHAVRAFLRLVEFGSNREMLYETPRNISLQFSSEVADPRRTFEEISERSSAVLSEDESKQVLAAYGIPVVVPLPAVSADEAVTVAEKIGYPVVLKVLSPQIAHKTDVGGVVLNLPDGDAVRSAFGRIVDSARRLRPAAEIVGVTVQRMALAVHGVELILGMKRDPVFGPVIMCGFGGIAAEVFQDKTLGLPPLNERLARRMLESLRVWPLLTGYRGRPIVNVEQLVVTLLRFSNLVVQLPELSEVDINPLLVTPEEVLALDARMVLDQSALEQKVRPCSHLSIGPYPEELVRTVSLKDGTEVLLRPIKPEDEPLWQELLASCSQESLRRRFCGLFSLPTHQMAARFCFIDYDREIALVAETSTKGIPQIIGVGRLIADADHEEAEFAILVGDSWQGLGVGSLLADACLDLCRAWRIRKIMAETSPDNTRMLGMFKRRGFALDYTIAQDVVVVSKNLPEESAEFK